MKHKPWKTRSSRPIYHNPWIDVREDVAEMPDGRTTIYGVIALGECVGVVPFVGEDRILLVRQYRYVQEDARWRSPPAGSTKASPCWMRPSVNSRKRRATGPGN
jgi:ADP-ribose pyrophosphatase